MKMKIKNLLEAQGEDEDEDDDEDEDEDEGKAEKKKNWVQTTVRPLEIPKVAPG